MENKSLLWLTALLGLILFGSGCEHNINQNSNTNSVINANSSSATNSLTTGTFFTSPSNSNRNSASTSTQKIYFTPSGLDRAAIIITAGQVIEFINNDTVIHRLISQSTTNSSVALDTTLSPGESVTHTFTTIGNYSLYDDLDQSSPLWRGQIEVK